MTRYVCTECEQGGANATRPTGCHRCGSKDTMEPVNPTPQEINDALWKKAWDDLSPQRGS